MKLYQFMSLISTGAIEYVKDAFHHQTVTLIHFEDSALDHGAFCVVENPDCIIAYAAFPRYSHDEALLSMITKELNKHLVPSETREICFNVYGENRELVRYARELGFVSDMEGYELQYDLSKEKNMPETYPFVEKGFSTDMLDNFIELFERAYFDLNKDNGWNTDSYRLESNHFLSTLQNYEVDERVRSFWIDDKLVGAYIIDGQYIRDFVIHPEFQNQGYGSLILKNCVNRMSNILGITNILLRVAQSNSGAKRFYERHHFVEQSYFAEHTWNRDISNY